MHDLEEPRKSVFRLDGYYVQVGPSSGYADEESQSTFHDDDACARDYDRRAFRAVAVGSPLRQC